MTHPQDPFTTPDPGGTPGRPVQAAGQPASAWEQQPASPAFGAPPGGGWGAPPAAERRNGLGTAALVLGLLGLFTSVFVIGGVLGLVAVVLGALGLGRVRRREADNRGMAVAGIVLGALAAIIAVVVGLGFAAIFTSDSGKQFTDCLVRAGSDQAAIDACEREFSQNVG